MYCKSGKLSEKWEKGRSRTLTLTSFLILDEKAFNCICLNKQNTEVSWRPWNSFHRHLPGIFSEAYGISSRWGLQLWTGDRRSLDGVRGLRTSSSLSRGNRGLASPVLNKRLSLMSSPLQNSTSSAKSSCNAGERKLTCSQKKVLRVGEEGVLCPSPLNIY